MIYNCIHTVAYEILQLHLGLLDLCVLVATVARTRQSYRKTHEQETMSNVTVCKKSSVIMNEIITIRV